MLQTTQIGAGTGALTGAAIDVTAIVGTLLGACLGAYVTWKIQQLQLQHEDRTRFHDRRLTVYAAFNDACQKVVAAIGTSAPYSVHHAEAVKTFEMLRLVASQGVTTSATLVYLSILGFTTAPPQGRAALLVTYNGQMAALCTAMRA